MDNDSCTTIDMAKGNEPKPQGRRRSYTIFLRVRPELGAAFDEYLESLRPKPTSTAAFEVALEEFLQARGFWPKKKPPK